jgi:hypothetical protein
MSATAVRFSWTPTDSGTTGAGKVKTIMQVFVTQNQLAAALNKALKTVALRVERGEIKPDAVDTAGRLLLFDVSRLESIRKVFESTPAVPIVAIDRSSEVIA